MASDTKSGMEHNFNWNSKPGFFSQHHEEEQKITLGPDLSWPLLSKPSSEQELNERRQKVRDIYSYTRKAA